MKIKPGVYVKESNTCITSITKKNFLELIKGGPCDICLVKSICDFRGCRLIYNFIVNNPNDTIRDLKYITIID